MDLLCTRDSEETPLHFNYIEVWNLELTFVLCRNHKQINIPEKLGGKKDISDAVQKCC